MITPNFDGQSFFQEWTEVPLVKVVEGQPLSYELRIDNLYAGIYELQLSDALGCVKTYASIKVDVDTNTFVPNVFTPNGDGVNDVFFIRNLPLDAALLITNQWGNQVYSSASYKNDWTGGNITDGIYFYTINLSGKTETGWLEIMRGNQ